MIYEQKLKELRNEKSMSQKEIAKILGLSEHTYSHYESGNATIPIKHLIACSDYFNVALDYILNFTSQKNYKSINKDIDKKLSGKRIKEFRKENKLTQNHLATMLNTTFSVISGYEIGRYIIATPFLYTICKKYNISADYLLGKIDSPKYLK